MTKKQRHRSLAAALLVVMSLDTILPTAAWALTSGPGQPEVQGFTPIGNTDMVDLFSGDFSYNIPLLDVEGYPINLSYRAGVTMEQEASWVGLGWSLTPGVVERNMRGVPDDFNGDKLVREMHLRENKTVGGQMAADFELFAFPIFQNDALPEGADTIGSTSINLQGSVGIDFNNQDGVSFTLGLTPSIRSAQRGKGTYTAGLGLSSSSHDGMRVQPYLGYDRSDIYSTRKNSWSLGFGTTLDSRAGLTQMSFKASAEQQFKDVVQVEGVDRTRASARLRGAIGTSFDFGSPTYTPQIRMPMKSTSLSGSFKLGSDTWGAFGGGEVSGFYSMQELLADVVETQTYGYLYLQNGQSLSGAQLDHNREKDGPYSADQSGLPIAQMTNDFFVATGQNISGSYRPYRSEVGHVFDPRSACTGSGGSIGVEIGVGTSFKWGADVVLNSSNSWSGDWTDQNSAAQRLRFRERTNGRSLAENVYFREANEPIVDPDAGLYSAFHQDAAVRPTMVPSGAYDMKLVPVLEDKQGNGQVIPEINHRSSREPRTQLFTFLTHHEVEAGLGLEGLVERDESGPVTPENIPAHHMSEVTIVAPDGTRNVYGIPAYNYQQTDVVFAIDPEADGIDEWTTKYKYSPEEASSGHPDSKDQYRSKETTPMYAHSFLLTAALSADYSDVDGMPGPTPNDLGSYTKFTYDLHDADYHWRAPGFGTDTARLDRGNLASTKDDKGSYSFGRKEIWYLTRVEGRNLVAIFYTSPRKDGLGIDENGTVNTGDVLNRLDSIALFSVTDMTTPIKTVHFEYDQDYSLCMGVPNRTGTGGKLTLKRVWFTYGKSHMGRTSPYVFTYSTVNPDYHPDWQDRWGQYKAHPVGIPNQSYPYAEQDPTAADADASAWNLTSVELPSGGTITVNYESDDYGYVQDREATRMFRLACISDDAPHAVQTGYADIVGETYLDVVIPSDLTGSTAAEFIAGLEHIYFRCKVSMDAEDKLGDDYVSGYARLEQAYLLPSPNDGVLRLKIKSVPIDGSQTACGPSPECVSPIFRTALEHLRLNYPNEAYSPEGFDEDAPFGKQLIQSMASATAGMLTGIGNLFAGPNKELKNKTAQGFCRTAKTSDCWIRLREPDQRKMGSGHRVRSIVFNDAWSAMGSQAVSKSYGQKYSYTNTDGTTSGVATYEPMVGADENPWRQPVYYAQKVKLSPDERFYQEEPFGESLFPSASVGYGRVTVEDLYLHNGTSSPTYATTQGTGRVVNEFHTAKDFPIILDRTDIKQKRRRSNFSLASLLGMRMNDHSHTSQGFVVETNDMHGKPRKTTVYPQPRIGVPNDPVSYVEYFYQSAAYGTARRLTNNATTIAADGTISTATIGRHYEFVADMREFGSKNTSGGLALNSETFFVILGVIYIPIPLPKYSMESTRYKSGVFVKKLHRFGLLEKVVKMENGGVVSTENLAYDAETGGVLLTKTRNDFEDPVYSLSFPAYWHYNGMGPAYRNIGGKWSDLALTLGTASGLVDADKFFAEGDELALWNADHSVAIRGWVDRVTSGSVHVINALGWPVFGTYQAKIVRSGRRNVMGVNMSNLTLLSDPLPGFSANVFSNILNAEVVEMSDHWRSECNCFDDEGSSEAGNPFRLNQRGIWRLNREHAWLTERTRSIEDNNTNIRRDGRYASFDPFYKLGNSTWGKEPSGWTMVREVTEYSGRGQELENQDALGLYSSATFGYGGSLPKTVARNARYRETAFEGFEDAATPSCFDDQMQFQGLSPGSIGPDKAHTGRRSLKVTSADDIELITVLVHTPCDPNGCTLSYSTALGGGCQATIVALNGTPPYTFTTNVLIGDPEITLLENGTGLCLSTFDWQWSAVVQGTDAAGCTFSYLFPLPE